ESGQRGSRLVRARNEVERSIELDNVVEEYVEVQRERLRHAVLAVVGGEVVVPLPHLAIKGSLGVDFDLLNVEPVVGEELYRRLDEAWMANQSGEDLVT